MYTEKEIQEARRKYYRKWRREHPEAVKAAQVRYWTKKAAEMRAAVGIHDGKESRGTEAEYR